jgi:transposase-like protein
MASRPKHPIFNDEEAARAHLERLRWPNGVVCVHCGAYGDYISTVKQTGERRKPTPKGKRYKPARAGRYYCKSCEGTFTVTVGTVLEDSHVPLHVWFYAFREFQSSKNGLSAHQLHRTIGVSYRTAWYMLHRIREAMRQGGLVPPMGGSGRVVEIDETGQGRQEGASKRKTRAAGITRSSPWSNTVLSLVERGGNVRSFHVNSTSIADLIPIIRENLSHEAQVMTDAASWYKFLSDRVPLASHDRIDHSSGEYGRYEDGRPPINTNTVEGYFSLLKRSIRGTYSHVSEKHLHRYLAEFDFRYSNRAKLGIDDAERTDRALRGIVGKRLTYRRTSGARSDA